MARPRNVSLGDERGPWIGRRGQPAGGRRARAGETVGRGSRPSPGQKPLRVVVLGAPGFPAGLALSRWVIFLSQGLLGAGADVQVISRPKTRYDVPDLAGEWGTWEGVPYSRVRGPIGELRALRRLRQQGPIDVAISTTKEFKTLLSHACLARMLDFKLVSTYHESVRSLYGDALDARLFEGFATSIVDGMLPISDYLVDFVRARSPGLPVLKTSPLCDFGLFEGTGSARSEPYFLFCGDATYLEVMQFVIDSFERLGEGGRTYLYLVTSGSEEKQRKLEERVRASSRRDFIRLLGYVPYAQLIDLYKGARALLIPLRPTTQDRARFPQKIAEYAASGSPIITTDNGEIRNYFEDGESALIAASYTVDAFADKMKCVLADPKRAAAIGRSGRAVGAREFDHAARGETIASFLRAVAAA